MEVDLRRLDGVVDESTLLHTWMNAESGEVIFQLGILAHPPQGQATRPERLIRLNSVSRIAAWLRELERIDHPAADGFPGFGYLQVTFEPIRPPVRLLGIEDLTAAPNSYSPELYWLLSSFSMIRRGQSGSLTQVLTWSLDRVLSTRCTSGWTRIRGL